MRLATFLLVAGSLQISAKGYSQTVNLTATNITLEQAFSQIERQTGYSFFIKQNLLEKARPVSLSLKNATIFTALEQCLKNGPLTYEVKDKIVYIKERMPVSPSLGADAIAPSIKVTGRVTDTAGTPMAGTTVVDKRTGTAVITDDDGQFSIDADPGDTLLFSFIGYKTESRLVDAGGSYLTVVLHRSAGALADIVVVGYGEEKKVNLTGSVVMLNAKQIENRGVANVSNILAGQAPGVTVLQRGGSPGRDAGAINIQGVGTLGNASPLVVVDGIKTNDYTQIDPNDIASISILKDAASSAIYGIDAANGVILITTKRGEKGKVKVNYDFQYGVSGYVKLPQKVNSADLATLYDAAQRNDGTPASGLKFSAADIQKFKDGSAPLTHPNTDWTKSIFSQPGVWSSHYLAISGGTDNTRYNVSFGYLKQGGIMESTGYKRYNFRTNFDQKLSERLSAGFNLAISQRRVNDPATVLGVGGETWYLHEAFQAWATDPIRTSKGDYAYPLWAPLNSNSVAYASAANGYSKNNDTRLLGTAFAEFEIIKGLKIKGIAATTRDFNYMSDLGLGVDLYEIDPVTGIPSATPNNTSASMPAIPSTSSVYRGFYHSSDNDYQVLLNYDKAFGKHQIKALLGYEARNVTNEAEDITRQNLSDPSLDQINGADPTNQVTDGNTTQYSSLSAFGRLNYIYNDRYLLEVNARRDATSRFARGHRSAVFPSLSAGWRVSKEKFFKIPFISDLKLRASYGVLGNEQINDYQYLATYVLGSYYVFGGVKTPGINEGPLANTIITWEKTAAKNIGLDISFFGNRLTFTGDYFIRDTRDILLNLSQPAVLGAAPPVANAGSVRNKGYDLILGYKDRVGKVSFYFNGNFSYVHNEITDLAGTEYPGRELGDPIYNIYGYVAEGLFRDQAQIDKHADQSALGGSPKPGDIMYKDINGDGKIDAKDEKNLGTYFPKITYGFSFGANYRSFDLSTVWSGAADVEASIAGSRLAQAFGDYGSSPIVAQLDSWTPDNQDAAYPRVSLSSSYNYIPSSFWVVNTSYLKLRNLQLGYTLPRALTERVKIAKLRVYVSGENLLTFSPCKLMDPESLSSGDPFFGFSGTAAYPTTKRYLAGISLTF